MAEPEPKKPRRYPVVLFHIPGWPSQEPNRPMVWRVCYDGMIKAERILKRMRRREKDCVWSIEVMTAEEARKVRNKPFKPPGWRNGMSHIVG